MDMEYRDIAKSAFANQGAPMSAEDFVKMHGSKLGIKETSPALEAIVGYYGVDALPALAQEITNADGAASLDKIIEVMAINLDEDNPGTQAEDAVKHSRKSSPDAKPKS